MFYGLATLVIVVVAAAAALTTLLIHGRVEFETRQHFHQVGSVVFLQLGVVFAVLLAFVFSEAWAEYTDAQRAIDRECSALHGVAMLAITLRVEQTRAVLRLEQNYIRSVVSAEWPVMRRYRTESVETIHKMEKLTAGAADLKPADPNAAVTRGQMLSLLADAHSHRETRIFEASNGIPSPIWIVLTGFSLALVLAVSFSSIQYRGTAAVIAAAFASGLVSILVVVRLLDFPFEGPLALRATDFRVTLIKVTDLVPSGEPLRTR